MSDVENTRKALLWLRLVAAIVLLLALRNLGQVVVVFKYARCLPELPMAVDWVYLAAMGGFWGLAFAVLGGALLLARPWARWPVLLSVTLYVAHGWGNRFFWQMSDYVHLVQGRRLLLDGLLLVTIWGLLSWKKTRVML